MEFRYEAVNAHGQTVSGRIEATGEREAARRLREQELTLLALSAQGGASGVSGRRSRRVTAQDKAIVIRELAILLQAGVPLAEAVESIGESHSDTAIGATFRHVHSKLRGGESLSQGLRSAPLAWPDFLLQLVAAGEHTGKLAQALQSAAAQMEYEQRVRSEMRSALIYPSVLVVSGIAATLVIFIVVVPRFASVLKSNKAQVPDISVWVLSLGLFVRENLLWVGLGIAALIAAVASALSQRQVRDQLLQRVARLPLLGQWLLETETGRWATMLGTLVENRVPFLKALEISHAGVRVGFMQAQLQQAMRDVKGGRKLADALADLRILNVTGLNLVRVGERTGELAAMLRALGTIHENASRERLKRFLILLEPTAILVIGAVIGVVMAAVMLAITSLGNVAV